MGLEKATAIVLRTIDYQESSKIITVLTESYGKFALIARGAKKPRGQYSGILEVGNTLDIHAVFKPASESPTAALKPDPPAPRTTTSYS